MGGGMTSDVGMSSDVGMTSDVGMLQPVLDTLNDMLRRLEEMSPDEKTLTQVKHYPIHDSQRPEATIRDPKTQTLLCVAMTARAGCHPYPRGGRDQDVGQTVRAPACCVPQVRHYNICSRRRTRPCQSAVRCLSAFTFQPPPHLFRSLHAASGSRRPRSASVCCAWS